MMERTAYSMVGAFRHMNKFYSFSLPIRPKERQNFWIGYNKYSQNITHWALTSRTTPTWPDTRAFYPARGGETKCTAARTNIFYDPDAPPSPSLGSVRAKLSREPTAV
jgi:hypothetical protein